MEMSKKKKVSVSENSDLKILNLPENDALHSPCSLIFTFKMQFLVKDTIPLI